MVDQADMTGTTAAAAFRDDDGAIRSEFLDQVREAIERNDAAALAGAGRRAARGRHRRPDRGARCRAAAALRRTDGPRVRLHRAHRGRRHGPRGNPRRGAVQGHRRGRPRSRFRRCRLHSRGPAEAGAGRNPRAVAAARARRARAHPALSGRLRRPAHADRVHRGAAVLDRRRRHRPHARDRRPAGPLLRALRGGRRRASCSARSRSTGCCAPSGRCRSPN